MVGRSRGHQCDGYPNETTTGRGLRLVQTLGQAWGVDQTDAAKTVWCELVRGA